MRIAAQSLERNRRVLDSPQIRRSPAPRIPPIAPIRFNLPALPQPAAPVVAAALNDDPFGVHQPNRAPTQAAVNYNGRELRLNAALAAQVAALPAFPVPPPNRRRRNNAPLPDAPVAPALPPAILQPQNPPIPAPIAVPNLPAPVRRGRRARNVPQPFPMPAPDHIQAHLPPPPPPMEAPRAQRRRADRGHQDEGIARKPFDPSWPVHNLGKMDVQCPHCGALHWRDEQLSTSRDNNLKFGMCCFQGKIELPKLHALPNELKNLYTGQDERSKKFRDNIRNYNNALAMTSMGVKVDHGVNQGHGPWVFKIHGQLSHYTGSLLPEPGKPPRYAQLYIYDPIEALDFRMAHEANKDLDRTTMQILQDVLFRRHPAVQLYQQAYELTRNMPRDHQCTIALRYDRETDRRRYNLPTAAADNEVAVILPGDGDQPTDSRDLILRRRHGEGLQRISEMHPQYHPLHYVLLFPTGQPGWHPKMPFKNGEDVPDDPAAYEPPQPEGGHDDEEENAEAAPGQRAKRRFISQTEYFRYRLHPRADESLHFFLAKRLFQEFVVDCWAISEQSRLNWVRMNQENFRAAAMQGLMDAIAADPTADGGNIGMRIILPSSFSGSTRNMIQNCQDALAINRHFHGADLFVTATANPRWPEIVDALEPGQQPSDRPDLIVRVFHMKMAELIKDICQNGIMGRTVARVWTIEFQKRGLPHMHMIVFFHPDHKLRTPEDVDSLISAEFPDPETEPEMFELVKKFMVHTPCGEAHNNPNSPCLVDKKCSKSFPKPARDQTTVNDDSYANLRRRVEPGKEYEVNGHRVNNQWVVAHCRYLIWKYRCHINVESIASVKAIKYIYKYVYKGHDRTTMEFGRCQDEIKMYLDSRYVSACESIWRIFHFHMHQENPAVVRLQVHLPNEELVTWNQDQAADLQTVVDRNATKDTTLTAYFKANMEYPAARDILYQDFPAKFVWKAQKRKWEPRQRLFAIGRMYYAHPNSGERFYLRLLLTTVKGATSFEDLRTVDGQLCPTFREACLRLGLLEDDQEWVQCLQEAGDMASGRQLRNLFVTILRENSPSDPRALWLQFRDKICDDLRHALRQAHPNDILQGDPTEEDAFDYGLYLIDRLLQATNKSLNDWPSMPLPQKNWDALIIGNRLIWEQRNYNVDHEKDLANQRVPRLNAGQRAAFDHIVHAVINKTGECFFLHGPGGTGKTYVYNTLCHHLRGMHKIVLCVASSGIAALLLIGGRTAHSRFKIPIKVHEGSTCSIGKNTELAELIRATDLVIWDEAPMQHRHNHEAVERTLRDIRNDERPFGGLTVVFGGDFKQILPVIIKGSRAQIVGACIQRSILWESIKVLKLTENMRLNTNQEEERNFAKWQLELGHGQHTDDSDNITIPENFKCHENTVASLIDAIYPGIHRREHHADRYYAERTILCSRNDDVDDVNNAILRKFPGETRVFHSADSVVLNPTNGDQGPLMYPPEYLNTINCSGLPLAKLSLKEGCPVMILRNLNASEGVCNGSRGIVTQMRSRVLEVRLLTGEHAGETIFVPRISLTPTDTQVPFEFCRRQFPVRLCFAMSINKAQGQSVAYVGLNLVNSVFAHGQLYVAISRVTSVHNIRAIWDEEATGTKTKNIVYPEVIID